MNMVYVACIGDEHFDTVYIVGVYTTQEMAIEKAEKYLNTVLNGKIKTPYNRWWIEEHKLDKDI